MGTVRWLMTPVSRFKYVFLSLLVIFLGLAGVIGGRAYYLSHHPKLLGVAPSPERPAPLSTSTPLPPSAPNPPMAAGSGVFDQIAAEVSGVYEQAVPTVVRLRATDGPDQLAGTGFFIDGQGTILTAYAVVGQAESVSVEVNGRTFPAKILGRDPRSGVAVLKINASPTPHLPLGEGMRLRPASAVVSVAFPYDLKAEPTFGFVAGFDVKYLTRFFATTHLRANLPIKPGQIGGPLLDSQGRVVGVLMLEIDEGKACYALPIEAAAKVASDIQRFGEPRHGWMGVGVMPDRSRPDRGAPVFVDRLYKGTPAEKSGLKMGDEVISIGNRPVREPSDILDAAFFSEVGAKVPVKVKRDGKEQIFTITVSARPDSSRIVEPAPLFPNPSGGPANQGMPVKAIR
ncbi:MAG: serine protease [Verrucomicrobia bacterium]|nr:serine protease [Pseudomonadota bacterium]NBS06425.1 serine protease [Verrucomicrobiota bacterium]NBT24322.1 serine protease [bacterium]NBS50585.1 serine protease [Verrucomicrobiota bacterium]NBV96548.1 serine protease [Verrucomicrobiota bacterium]